MKRIRNSIPLAAAAALILGAAGPAGAVVTVTNSTVASDGAGDNFSVSCSAGVLSASGTITTGDPCVSIESISVDLGAGNDTVSLANVTAATFPALVANSISASDGEADTVTGSPLKDQIDADSSDTVNGGEGSDLITGGGVINAGGGDDTMFESGDGPVSGGSGDDRFVQTLPINGIDGGDGLDSWEVDFDQIQVSVGTGGAVTFIMAANGLTLDAPSLGVSQLFPGPNMEELYLTMFKTGSQTYDGSGFAGVSHVRGMDGPDDLRGGPSDDNLYGGGANDTVTGNAGADHLYGGGGDDTIQARDGVADKVDCGLGTDTVVADASDSVVGCESVHLPPPPPAVAPETSAIKGPKSVTQPDKAKFKFSSSTAGATFQCKLDKKKWKKCSSPHKVKSSKLDPGKHKLKVRAVAGGLTDASPSKISFKVKKG